MAGRYRDKVGSPRTAYQDGDEDVAFLASLLRDLEESLRINTQSGQMLAAGR